MDRFFFTMRLVCVVGIIIGVATRDWLAVGLNLVGVAANSFFAWDLDRDF